LPIEIEPIAIVAAAIAEIEFEVAPFPRGRDENTLSIPGITVVRFVVLSVEMRIVLVIAQPFPSPFAGSNNSAPLGVVEIACGFGRDTFPPEASFLMCFSYVVYALALGRKPQVDQSERAVAYHQKRGALALCAAGFIGVFLAGEVLTFSAETLLEDYQPIIGMLGNPVTIAAIILGAAGALPEHGVALTAASKGKTSIALGNLLGGVLQIVLLIMGVVGIFVLIPLDRYVLFQIVAIAGSLWFLLNAITDDHELDVFEGAMIVILQLFVFSILIWGEVAG
jgi:Ca2+/H+ antiporter